MTLELYFKRAQYSSPSPGPTRVRTYVVNLEGLGLVGSHGSARCRACCVGHCEPGIVAEAEVNIKEFVLHRNVTVSTFDHLGLLPAG